jgi:hypothetical protein
MGGTPTTTAAAHREPSALLGWARGRSGPLGPRASFFSAGPLTVALGRVLTVPLAAIAAMFGFVCLVEGGRYEDGLEAVACRTFVLSGIYLLVSGVLGSARFFCLGLVTFGCALAVLELAPPPSGKRVSGAAAVGVLLKAYIAGSCLVALVLLHLHRFSAPASEEPESIALSRTGEYRAVTIQDEDAAGAANYLL